MWRSLRLAMLISAAFPALAQQAPSLELPQVLEGKWSNSTSSRLSSGRIAFHVDSRAANGSLTGKWTFEGGDGKAVAGGDVDVFLDPK